MELEIFLQPIMKDNLSFSDFISKIKTVGAKLNTIEEKMSKRDLVMYNLNGLGSDYNLCTLALNNYGDDLSVEEVHSQLLTYEHLLAKYNRAFDGQMVQTNLVRGLRFDDNSKGPNFNGGMDFNVKRKLQFR